MTRYIALDDVLRVTSLHAHGPLAAALADASREGVIVNADHLATVLGWFAENPDSEALTELRAALEAQR